MMKKILIIALILANIALADKVKTIKEIRINNTVYSSGTFLNVSSNFAKYLCNEGNNENKRVQKAIRTPEEEESKNHINLLNL